MSVTWTPAVWKIVAYSVPESPGARDASVRGISDRVSRLSLSMTVRSSNSNASGRNGQLPTAMTALSAVTVRDPSSVETTT